MLQLQLYVEGQQVDLFDDESVSITQSIQDVRDIEKVFTDFSRTFNVPASKNNNKIFKHFHNYHIIGFDARRKVNAALYLNHQFFKEGKIKLEGATRKDNIAHTYRLTFFGSGVNLKDILNEDKLDSLRFLRDNFNINYTDANIKTYLSNGLDITAENLVIEDAIVFPLITHTKRLIYDSTTSSSNINTTAQNNIAYEAGQTNHGLELSQLKPAIRLHAIIEAIQREYNITFSDDFFNETNESYYNLYLWLHNKTGGLFAEQTASNIVENIKITDEGRRTFATRAIIQENTNTTINLNFRRKVTLDFTVKPSVADEFNFIIFNGSDIVERFDGIKRDSQTLKHVETDIDITNGVYSFAIESQVPSTYEVEIKFRRNSNRYGLAVGSVEILTDVSLKSYKQIPDIKVIDFLTGLFKMFNLTSFQNDDGIIEIKTLDSFYSESTNLWDITEHVDKNQSTVDSVLPYKQINLRYDGQDNFFAKNHKELFNQEWGTLRYNVSEKFEGKPYTIKLPFEHFKYERLKDIKDDSFVDLQWGWSADIKQESTLGKPLLFYPVLKTVTIGVIESDGDLSQVTSVYLPSNSIALGDKTSKNINFNAEVSEFGITENNATTFPSFPVTLFSQYYENYIREIFDQQRRITKLKAYLPLSITLNLSLADKVRVFDNIYRINTLTTNFENNESQIELINTTDVPGRTIEVDQNIPDRFDPEATCVRADSTLYDASNIVLRADLSCDVDGLGIKQIADLVPQDVSVGNDIVVDDFSSSVSTTQPTLTTGPLKTNETNAVFLTHTIFVFGKIANVSQVFEYGFIHSTNASHLNSSDLTTLKTAGGSVSLYSGKGKTAPLEAVLRLTGLSSGDIIYYKFYVITNNPSQPKTEIVSTLQTSAVSDTCPTTGTKFVNIYNPSLTDTITVTILNTGTLQSFDIPPQSNIIKTAAANECLCDDTITATGTFTIVNTGTDCT